MIKNLHTKIDKQNNEITRINEILTVERTSNYKVEISTLQRKLKEKEKAFNDNKKTFENIIAEFKIKINNLIAYNDSYASKLHEMESYNEAQKKEIEEKQEHTEKLNYKIEEINYSYQKEAQKNKDLQTNYFEFKEKVAAMLSGVLEVFRSQNEHSSLVNSLANKCHIFF